MICARFRFQLGAIGILLGWILVDTAGAGQPAASRVPAKEPRMTLQTFDQVQPQQHPWGWIRWLLNSEIDPQAEMTFGMVYIKPGQENPLHLHPNSAEYLHVLEGSCDHLVGSQWAKLKAGDTVRIPKNVPHRARTTSEACRVIVVYDTGSRQMVTLDEPDNAAGPQPGGKR